MAIQKVSVKTETNNRAKNNYPVVLKNTANVSRTETAKSVSFGSASSWAGDTMVSMMNNIDSGGFIVSFLIADGLGFILPRCIKGLLRNRPEKKDKDGNTIYDENGKPEHSLNWAFARKEFIREIITGPSAYFIPLGMIAFIKKHFGTANDVKVAAIQAISDTTKSEVITAENKEINRRAFDKAIYKSIAGDKYAEQFADLQAEYTKHKDELTKATDKAKKKELKAAMKEDIGKITELFIKHQKETNPSANVLSTSIKVGDKTIGLGPINKLPNVLEDYFDDISKYIKKNEGKNLSEVLAEFKGHKSGSRIMTILSMFAAVTAFYMVIPKLYNAGLTENPATANSKHKQAEKTVSSDKITTEVNNDEKITFGKKDGGFLENLGNKYGNGKFTKKVADFFEFNGAEMTGQQMSLLLFGGCIPARMIQSIDLDDLAEGFTRDALAFSALLFGSKALSRLFTDILVKQTGLVLNEKHNQADGSFKRAFGYFKMTDTKYHILSGTELNAKYSKIGDYKGGISGFAEFISDNGGNLKKTFTHDENIKNKLFEIFKEAAPDNVKGVEKYEDLSNDLFAKDKFKEIMSKDNIKAKVKELEELFNADNKILRKAKVCNSSFGFLSTFVLVPSFIIWLTGFCERMTEKRIAKREAAKNAHGDSFNKAK